MFSNSPSWDATVLPFSVYTCSRCVGLQLEVLALMRFCYSIEGLTELFSAGAQGTIRPIWKTVRLNCALCTTKSFVRPAIL